MFMPEQTDRTPLEQPVSARPDVAKLLRDALKRTQCDGTSWMLREQKAVRLLLSAALASVPPLRDETREPDVSPGVYSLPANAPPILRLRSIVRGMQADCATNILMSLETLQEVLAVFETREPDTAGRVEAFTALDAAIDWMEGASPDHECYAFVEALVQRARESAQGKTR
jgi:hypothetical protein